MGGPNASVVDSKERSASETGDAAGERGELVVTVCQNCGCRRSESHSAFFNINVMLYKNSANL